MIGGRWGKEKVVDRLPDRRKYFHSRQQPSFKETLSAQPAPPQSQVYLILSLHRHNVPPPYVCTCQVTLLKLQIRLCV